MSQLKAEINEDLKTAMRAREQHTVTTLRGLLAAVKQVEVDNRIEVDDARIVSILQTEIKKRRDALQFAHAQKREDLIQQNDAEVKMLQKYLGEQLSEDQLAVIIQELIAAGNDSMGKIMGALNAKYKGKFEGRAASELSRTLLEKKG